MSNHDSPSPISFLQHERTWKFGRDREWTEENLGKFGNFNHTQKFWDLGTFWSFEEWSEPEDSSKWKIRDFPKRTGMLTFSVGLKCSFSYAGQVLPKGIDTFKIQQYERLGIISSCLLYFKCVIQFININVLTGNHIFINFIL